MGVAGGQSNSSASVSWKVFGETKTIQYNSNDNCYVFCYKKQIETQHAGGVGVSALQLMKNYVRHMPHGSSALPQERKCLLNRFTCAKNTSSSETCSVSIHFRHTILIEGDGESLLHSLPLSLTLSLQFQRKFRNHSGH